MIIIITAIVDAYPTLYEEKPTRQVRQVSTDTKADAPLNIEAVKNIAPHIDKLKPEEIEKYIKGASGTGIEFKTTDVIDCGLEDCKKPQPTDLTEFCIYCGRNFV